MLSISVQYIGHCLAVCIKYLIMRHLQRTMCLHY